MTLMTSVALTDIFWASSCAVVVSPTPTSRMTFAVGSSKPCRCSTPMGALRSRTRCFFLRRDASPPMCSSARPYFVRRSRSASAAVLTGLASTAARSGAAGASVRPRARPERSASVCSRSRCSANRRVSSAVLRAVASSSIRRRFSVSRRSDSRRSRSSFAASSASRALRSISGAAARACSSSTSRLM